MPGALSAAIQCLFHDAISFAMTLSVAIQHLFLYANSFAMPVALSAAMERSVRFHSLCLLPSRRQSLCGFHNAASFALPVAFSAALQRWSHNAIIGYACCLFCGNSCLSHDAISFARTRSASIQRLLPLSAAVQRLLRYAISLAMPVALSAALELLMRFHSLPSRRKSCEGLRVLVFRAPLRAAIHAGFFSAFRAVLGSQSVRPLPGLSYSGVGWVCIEPLRCSASVGISA